jgi:hypothetical protein
MAFNGCLRARRRRFHQLLRQVMVTPQGQDYKDYVHAIAQEYHLSSIAGTEAPSPAQRQRDARAENGSLVYFTVVVALGRVVSWNKDYYPVTGLSDDQFLSLMSFCLCAPRPARPRAAARRPDARARHAADRDRHARAGADLHAARARRGPA